MKQKFTNSEIAKHYEGCEEHYRYWWNLAKSKSMHYGYWNETTSSFHDAMMNINKVMSEKIGISQLDHVLDAGCGVGGSSIWLAKNRNCRVTGITLSEKQRIQAEQYANIQGTSHKVDFRLEDFTNTSFPDKCFDVVWAIESVCHAEDKMLFLKEAYRLLKPGGRLIVADFFNRNGLEGSNKELMDKMAYGWAISSFTTIEAFEKAAEEINFKKISIEDASKAIRRSAWLLYLASFPGILFTKLYAVFYNPSHLTKYNARTANIQYPALKKGLWEYQIFQAVKE